MGSPVIQTLENVASVKIHLPRSIHGFFKKANGIWKSDDSPPLFLKPSLGPGPALQPQHDFFEKKWRSSIRSTGALPKNLQAALLGPEVSQNLRNINIYVFHVFDLWRWMVLVSKCRWEFTSRELLSEARIGLKTLEGLQK